MDKNYKDKTRNNERNYIEEQEGTFEAWDFVERPQREVVQRESFDQKLEQWERAEKKKKLAKKAKQKKKKKKKIALAIILPIVAIIVLFGALGVASVIPAKNEVSNLKSVAKEFLKNVQAKDTPKSEESFKELCESTKKLEKILDGPFYKIVRVIPRVRKELDVADELLVIVTDAEETLLTPFIEKMKEYPLTELKVGDGFNTALMNAYLDFLEEKQDYLEEMLVKIDSLDPNSLVGGYIGEKKAKVYELVDSYHEATALLPLLRTIIGDGSDRLYILAAQNSAEIRASGGFPGSMGTIRIKDGVLTIGDFKSVYSQLNDYVADDADLDGGDFVFGTSWLVNPWDSCFVPDFPKTASVWATAYRDKRWVERYEFRQKEYEEAIQREEEKAAALAAGEEYEEKTVESNCVPDEYFNDYDYYMDAFHVDGVISMTPAIIQMMLEDVGEIELSNGMKLDATNATKVLQYDLYMEYFSAEKYFYGSTYWSDAMFAETAKKAMKGFVGNFEISKFSYYYKLFKTGIDQHIINIWMEDPDEQKIVEDAGAAGRLCYDESDPFTGIYFSLADACKLGWYVDIVPEIGEPVENYDGSKTYDVTVDVRNVLKYNETYNLTWYIIGSFNGTICSYIHILAPAGGTLSNIWTSNYTYFYRGTYHGLDMAYKYSFMIDPEETVTIHYQVTVPAGVDKPLRAVTTPTLTAYR